MHASAALATAGFVLVGCKTASSNAQSVAAANAAKRQSIDSQVDATLARLAGQINGARELLSKAEGVLVFPRVLTAGFWVGGQFGDGALRVGGRTAAYYSTVGGSFGFQFGVQSNAIVFVFLNRAALAGFMASQGWSAGADATVSLVTMGANGTLDTSSASSPIGAIVLTNAGLMAGVSVKGVKVSRLVI